MKWLKVILICAPLCCAAITIIMPIVRGVDFDYKWTVMCLCISLLAFSVDRLELLKIFGLEAKLSKLDKATEKAYATIEEVEKSRQDMRLLGERLAIIQAQTVRNTNRFLSQSILSDKKEAIQTLVDTLKEMDASPEAIQKIEDIGKEC